MPATTVNQQGDNRVVSLSMSVEAVDQFQVLTSTPPAEYMGAGAMNFTMKSGGLKYHGQVSDFVRNTAFDTWGFTSKALTVVNALGSEIKLPSLSEHQNELSVSVGGRVPKTGQQAVLLLRLRQVPFAHWRQPGPLFHSNKGHADGRFYRD